MQAGMYSMSVPVYTRMLGNLSTLLDKAAAYAEARKIDPAVLLAARLYPDMFPLLRQVQLATDFAKGSCARLAGVDVPRYEDTETTIDQLKARIASIVAYINGLNQQEIDTSAERDITLQIRDQTVVVKGMAYLNHMAVPNFYFHLTTAYALLRHNGVEVGKRDFIGSM